MTPPRPYLVRALIDWIVDNDCTPFVAIASDIDGVSVPPGTAKDGRVVLNLSASATRNLEISNENLTVDCRFDGQSFHVTAPMGAVVAVFARENGEGMSFEPLPVGQTPSTDDTPPTKPPPKQGPKLTLVT
ncbi:MAG: ClpXP protease specificity-enhancing factor [Gammaproteobacteria bacterium]|nr:ClpXP protease specificity-enhancing factor [Gammaproteobacteria bacterium]MYB39532.1 ClpXP protease specificity-enhancing factor [Gammaproteobacteria bacterium]